MPAMIMAHRLQPARTLATTRLQTEPRSTITVLTAAKRSRITARTTPPAMNRCTVTSRVVLQGR